MPGANTSHTICASLVKPMSNFLIDPEYRSALPSVRVNRQLSSFDDPKTKTHTAGNVTGQRADIRSGLTLGCGYTGKECRGYRPGLSSRIHGMWSW